MLMSQIKIQNRAHQIANRPTTKYFISLIVKTATIWETPTILTMFHPLLTLLNITNASLCRRLSF